MTDASTIPFFISNVQDVWQVSAVVLASGATFVCGYQYWSHGYRGGVVWWVWAAFIIGICSLDYINRGKWLDVLLLALVLVIEIVIALRSVILTLNRSHSSLKRNSS